MVALRVNSFGGMLPVLDERLIPDNAAVLAENCLLDSGAAIPLPLPVELHTPVPGTEYAYRIPANYEDAAFLYGSLWLEFVDPDTTVIRSPVIDDQYDRYYWVSPTEPPKYNTRARIANGDPAWLLGIPAPTVAPTVTPSGGVSTTLVTRSYVYTYVSDYGEEGPPSPPTTITGKIDDTYAIGCTPPALADTGVVRNITKLRIYRTVTDITGTAEFYRIAELTLPNVNFNDTYTDDVVTLNQILESTDWSGPPSDLDGFVLMPNGIMAGWRGGEYAEVWFSEPFRPHAWPAKYVQTLEYPVIGMGVSNQTLVACTAAYPVTLQGVHPGYITASKLTSHEPCVSRGSILSTPEGVYYASTNGLVLVIPGQVTNITKDIVSKDKWNKLLTIPKLRAARLGMSYFAYGVAQAGIFQGDTFQNDAFVIGNTDGATTGVVINPTSQRVAFSMLEAETPVMNCYNDPWSGEVFIISGDKVRWLDIANAAAGHHTMSWVSKIFQANETKNFAAARVFFKKISPAPNDQPVFRYYVDGALKKTFPITKSGMLIRLPSGFKGDFLQFSITGKVQLLSVHIATSVKDLVNV